jgi:two-component system, sensor histidine kinase and response regulator
MNAPQDKIKCLLVDDLEENLVALSALLRRDDVEVLQARSGAEALDLLLQHEVALALVDVQMPEMDGFELAELIRGSSRTSQVPLIFITAGGRDLRRMFKGYELGAVDYLYKPIDAQILLNKAKVFFQLHRQKLQLERALRERTETLHLHEMFTAVLGHDLRTPLSSIVVGAQLLQRFSKDEMVNQTATRMLTSARWMSRMIANLLDLSRARLAGGVPLNREVVDLSLLLERVMTELGPTHPDCRVDVRRSGNLRGEWDPDRLTQVISNLVGNAMKHGDHSAPVEVELDGSDAERVAFTVINLGTMPAIVLAHVFDPFRTGTEKPGRTDGLGLGMYIAKQIVEAHEGRIAVESGPDNRTIVRVELPRGQLYTDFPTDPGAS